MLQVLKGRMLHWIKDFFNNRSIQVKVWGDLSETTNIINATPQGAVSSPVLFNIIIDDIFFLGNLSLQTMGLFGRGVEISLFCFVVDTRCRFSVEF